MTSESISIDDSTDVAEFDGPRVPLYNFPPTYEQPRPGFGYPTGFVAVCPFCGDSHRHGLANGTRESHCERSGGTYDLYLAGPIPPEHYTRYLASRFSGRDTALTKEARDLARSVTQTYKAALAASKRLQAMRAA